MQTQNQTSRRDEYFLGKVESNDREIARLRERMSPRIGFVNRHNGPETDDIRDAKKVIADCAAEIKKLKEQNARILANRRR